MTSYGCTCLDYMLLHRYAFDVDVLLEHLLMFTHNLIEENVITKSLPILEYWILVLCIFCLYVFSVHIKCSMYV
jgi:hypothetical protein